MEIQVVVYSGRKLNSLLPVALVAFFSYSLGSYHAHRWHMQTLENIRQKLAERIQAALRMTTRATPTAGVAMIAVNRTTAMIASIKSAFLSLTPA